MALGLHLLCAGEAQLHAGIGVDRIVDAAMAGDEAAQHLLVGRIDDGITGQAGDVALPQIQTALSLVQRRQLNDSLASAFFLQIEMCIRDRDR